MGLASAHGLPPPERTAPGVKAAAGGTLVGSRPGPSQGGPAWTHMWTGIGPLRNPSTRAGRCPLPFPGPPEDCCFSSHLCHHQRRRRWGWSPPALPSVSPGLWLVLGAGLEALTRVISVPESEELRSRGAGDGQRMQAAGPASGQETHVALSLQLDAQTEEQCKACCQRLWASVPALPGFCLPTDLFPLRCFHLRKQVFHLLP